MQIVKNTDADDHYIAHLPNTLICFSHLRWDFVLQRPQHILNRLAKRMQIFYIEEPVEDNNAPAHYAAESRGKNLTVIVPHLPGNISQAVSLQLQRRLFNDFMDGRVMEDTGFWYYTPMALSFTRKYQPEVIIFDCMDELSAFKFAPQELKDMEKELLAKADIVFTGGQSLYEAKKDKHANIHAFPSSIEKQHFAKARDIRGSNMRANSDAQLTLGFYGVIDERFDIDLIRGIAEQRPNWEIVLIGPVVKIDPTTLPANANIKYTGSKTYDELPQLISNWDVALIPFLLNKSTRFISPTKTPEYLAAGLPVISTPIKDVIYPYGKKGLVMIGQNAADFVDFAEQLPIGLKKDAWLKQVDLFLSNNSWDGTTARMLSLISKTLAHKQPVRLVKTAG